MSEHDDVVVASNDEEVARSRQNRFTGRERLPGVAISSGIAILCWAIMAAALSGCATKPESPYSSGEKREAPGNGVEGKLGIRMEGLRLSAAGYMLDFRYRVTDPAKAEPLLNRKIRPYLLDETSGAQLGVPDTAKLGQLRTTARNKVVPERDCYILFANPGRFVQAGTKMTLVMGDLRIENLTVE